MSGDTKPRDALLDAYELVLHEIGGYPIDRERLNDALPMFEDIMKQVRRLDELDLDEVEPATTYALFHAPPR